MLHQLLVAGPWHADAPSTTERWWFAPTLVVSAAAVRSLWAQAVPVPVIAHVFPFGFPPRVCCQKGLSSGPGQSFGHVFSLSLGAASEEGVLLSYL